MTIVISSWKTTKASNLNVKTINSTHTANCSSFLSPDKSTADRMEKDASIDNVLERSIQINRKLW